MNRRVKRNVAIGAAAALAVAGGGAAYCATSSNDRQDALLNDAAQRLNVTPDKLRAALKDAFGDQLDQAVKDGKLTRAQADAIKQRAQQDGGLPPLGGPGGPRVHRAFDGPGGPRVHRAFDGPGGPGPIAMGLGAAAKYLGLSDAQLRARLQKGDSLADVAKAQGKSVDGLQQALLDAAKTDLDQAVKDGKLTQTKADAMLKDLTAHVGDLVQGKGVGAACGPGGPGGPGGPRDRHMFFGPPPGARSGGDNGSSGSQSGSSTTPGSYDSGPSTAVGAA